MTMHQNGVRPPVNYAEYLNTPDSERWELIDGVPFQMSAAPTDEHQRILGRLHGEFYIYLRGKDCEVFQAPLDIVLFTEGKGNEEIKNVVQPDLSVICDKSKFAQGAYKGTPALVAEVLSPSTAHRDRDEKLKLYRKAGVKEYWIVDPHYQTVEVYDFHAEWPKKVYRRDQVLKVGLFEDFELDLKLIFA